MSKNSSVANAADKSQVKKAGARDRERELQEIEDVKSLLDTPLGRRFYWRYLGNCGVFETSFTGSSATFYKEGKRAIGLMLMADINEHMPDAYVLMIKENQIQDLIESQKDKEQKTED